MDAGAWGFDVEQAEPCLCGRMKSALYLALPKREAFLLKPPFVEPVPKLLETI